MADPSIAARLRLAALARRLAPTIARRFLDAVARLRSAVDVERLAARIDAGDTTGALRELLGTPEAPGALNSIGDAVRDAMRQSGTAWGTEAVVVPSSSLTEATATIRIGFDPVHPAVLRALAEQRRAAIVDATHSIAAGARVTVIDAVERTTTAGVNPRVAAREVRDVLGLSERDAKWIASYRKQVETLDPAALERELRDVRTDRTVRKAIAEGKPLTPEQVDKAVAAYEKNARMNTATTMSRDAALDAAREGQRQVWVAAASEGRVDPANVTKTWKSVHDPRTRLGHRLLDGVTIAFDAEWYDTDDGQWKGVPSGFNCRCVAVYRVEIQAPKPNPVRGGFAAVERAARDKRAA